VLSTIYQLKAGATLLAAFRDRLAVPLGLEDYRDQDGFWIREPAKSQHWAYEFRMSARDLARVGQLVLQEGRWEERDLVPPTWLRESLTIHSPFEGGGGYGYLWWIDAHRAFWRESPLPRLGAIPDVAAVGNGGQMILVLPSIETIVVTQLERDQYPDAFDNWGYRLAELMLEARSSEAASNATFVSLRAERLPNPPPVPEDRVAVPITGDRTDFAGRYAVTPNVTATITSAWDGLFVEMPGRGAGELFQEAPDRFFLKTPNVVVVFERDASGRVTGVSFTEGGRMMRGAKVP
jgi:CubicO group peptidase (beta-lactamase class C family)